MENITPKRDKEIEELTNFIKSTNEFLMGTISSLGWSKENTEKNEEKLTCPFDSSHRLYPKSVEKHIENCLWKAEGYSEEDVPLSIPSVPPDASNFIKIDEQLMEDIFKLARMQCPSFQGGGGNRLIPRTSNRLLADFTPEERRILYDYVVANTEPPDIGEDIADLNKVEKTEGKKFSYLELLAQERNLKRRRAKHRGVHTNKKSHVEIMREVINQQMEMLTEHLAEKSDSHQHSPDSRDAEAETKQARDNRRDSRRESVSSHSRHSRIPSAGGERDFANGSEHSYKRKSNVRRDSSRENHRHSSRNDSVSRSSHEALRHRHHHRSSSRSHDSREKKSRKRSEERKRPRNRSRDRSIDRKERHHHKHKKHKSKSKRSRSRDEERSRKR